MLKKYTSILFLTAAYIILLGHSFIPHHHHDSQGETNHHNSPGDSKQHTCTVIEEDEGSEGILGHLLSHFVHGDEGIFFLRNHNTGNAISPDLFLIYAVLTNNFFEEYLMAPILQKPPLEHFSYTSPPALFSGLRAPPIYSI